MVVDWAFFFWLEGRGVAPAGHGEDAPLADEQMPGPAQLRHLRLSSIAPAWNRLFDLPVEQSWSVMLMFKYLEKAISLLR